MKAARPVRKGADGKVLRQRGVTRRRPTLLKEGRVRGKPPESSPGQAPSCIGAQVPPPAGVGEKICGTRVGLGEEGWKPAGERAGESATPVRGAAWWNGATVQAVAGRRRPGVQAGH